MDNNHRIYCTFHEYLRFDCILEIIALLRWTMVEYGILNGHPFINLIYFRPKYYTQIHVRLHSTRSKTFLNQKNHHFRFSRHPRRKRPSWPIAVFCSPRILNNVELWARIHTSLNMKYITLLRLLCLFILYRPYHVNIIWCETTRPKLTKQTKS